MSQSKKYNPKRTRQSITGIGGLSVSLHPSRKGKVSDRKRRGKPDITRREYNN